MPGHLRNRLLTTGARRVPGLRRLPLLKLLVLAELAILARDHFIRLDPAERRRLIELERKGHGRASSPRLTPAEREELVVLLAKIEPRHFAGTAVGRLSPVPLPGRMLYGPKRKRP